MCSYVPTFQHGALLIFLSITIIYQHRDQGSGTSTGCQTDSFAKITDSVSHKSTTLCSNGERHRHLGLSARRTVTLQIPKAAFDLTQHNFILSFQGLDMDYLIRFSGVCCLKALWFGTKLVVILKYLEYGHALAAFTASASKFINRISVIYYFCIYFLYI